MGQNIALCALSAARSSGFVVSDFPFIQVFSSSFSPLVFVVVAVVIVVVDVVVDPRST